MNSRFLAISCIVAAMMIAGPASAGTFKKPKAMPTVEFSADGSDPSGVVTIENAVALTGVASVIIPQFTVEFVEATDGLGVTRDQNITVTYHLASVSDADRQAITDRLYQRFVATLQARGLTVAGPLEAASTRAWSGVAANVRTEPAALKRATLETRIFSARGAPYLIPSDAQGAPGAAAKTAKTAGQGLAMAGMLNSRLAGAGRMVQGATALSRVGAGLGGFNAALAYAKMEPELAAEAQSAVLSVRLVVGLRETDKPNQLFAALRTASSLIGEPRLSILKDGTALSFYAPNPKMTRTQVGLTSDLLIAEDLLQGRTSLRTGAVGTASNIAARGAFLASVVVGGGVDLYQSHHVDCAPDPAAFATAVERNLGAVSDLMLSRLP